jgi:hypothetical protein
MAEARKRGGAARLLARDDLDTPLVGWKPTSQGEGGLFNPRGFAMLRIVMQRESDAGTLRDLYDQPVIVESPGAIVVCQAGSKVGLVESYRMVGERILEAGMDYIARLDADGRWDELLLSLGEWKWELPRGIAPGEGKSLEEIVVSSARMEALSEAGFRLDDVKIVGRINPDYTFFPHPQYAVHGRIVGVEDQNPEELEIIGRTRLFYSQEIRQMVDAGDFDDGIGLAALACAGFSF